jgi:hypothetical protein
LTWELDAFAYAESYVGARSHYRGLTALDRARVTITLEIHAELPDGAPDQVVRTVSENCRTLRFTS